MDILAQFLFRLSFGLAASMALTSSRQVTSGYFRVHSYVLLGLNVLAGLAVFSKPELHSARWPVVIAAGLAYLCSAVWLYEASRAGVLLLAATAGTDLLGAFLTSKTVSDAGLLQSTLIDADSLTSGLLLGTTMAAMLLGHWYLNTPTMALAPLRKLVWFMGTSTIVRIAVCGLGLSQLVMAAGWPTGGLVWLLVLRWVAGLAGALAVAVMTWMTLKIPNTQSATGILYVGVIVTFLGELASQLLLDKFGFPV